MIAKKPKSEKANLKFNFIVQISSCSLRVSFSVFFHSYISSKLLVPNYFSRVCFFIFIVRRNSYHFQQAAAISTAKEREWKRRNLLEFYWPASERYKDNNSISISKEKKKLNGRILSCPLTHLIGLNFLRLRKIKKNIFQIKSASFTILQLKLVFTIFKNIKVQRT